MQLFIKQNQNTRGCDAIYTSIANDVYHIFITNQTK